MNTPENAPPSTKSVDLSSEQVVVARNIVDESESEKKSRPFATRRRGEPAYCYVSRSSVSLRHVNEVLTGGGDWNFETGLGCGLVLVGDDAGTISAEEIAQLEEIRFNGHYFEFESDKVHMAYSPLVVLARDRKLAIRAK